MQHVTSSEKVEGQDIVDSIHPAPSSDHFRKEGRNTYIGIGYIQIYIAPKIVSTNLRR